jgi:Aromatic-ring hydroxylase, C-terminal
VAGPDIEAAESAGIAVYHDAERQFATVYGAGEAFFLIRPDGYVGWRGLSCREPALMAYLRRVFLRQPS